MAKPLSELLKKVSPEVKAKASLKAARMLGEMELAELREALGVTQQEMSAALDIGQSSVSKFEKRDDVSLSKLRCYLQAMGATLNIVAEFPDGTKVKLCQHQG